jgi:DNA primase
MANVLDLLRHFHTPKKAASTKGGEYASPCPACNGTDRFRVWPEANDGQGSYWCRGCGKGGDAIQFLRDFQGMSYPEACAYLGKEPQKYSRSTRPTLSRKGDTRMFAPTEPTAPPQGWQDKARKLIVWAFESLIVAPSTHPVKSWMAERGIPETAIKRFGLGWNPEDLFRPRDAWSLPEELKEGRPKKLWIPAGLTIPLLAAHKDVHRVRIRREADDPRYYVLPGSSMACMVTGAESPRVVVVVESELDAIMLHEQVRIPEAPAAIIALGNSSRKPDAEAHNLLKSVPVILNALDADRAGAAAAAWWMEQYPRTIRWPVPLGKDPGEAYQQKVNMSEWVRKGCPKGWFL